jgi:MHS family proline/betaine transporter-like MFS transporter
MMVFLSDKFIRRRSVLITGFIAALMFSVPMFILAKDSYFYLLAVFVFFGIIVAVPLGVAPATLLECFPTRGRHTSYSLIYNIGVGIFGGVTPMIYTWLIQATGNNLAPAFSLYFFLVISIIALLSMRDRSYKPLQ